MHFQNSMLKNNGDEHGDEHEGEDHDDHGHEEGPTKYLQMMQQNLVQSLTLCHSEILILQR